MQKCRTTYIIPMPFWVKHRDNFPLNMTTNEED
jgi:hypothetical protein